MFEISPEDRYLLRKSQMDAEKKDLEAQKAHQDLERLVLEIEHRNGLIADGRSLDPRTGTVNGIASSRKNNGKDNQEALMSTVPDEISS